MTSTPDALPASKEAEAVTESCGCVFRDLNVPCRNPKCEICHDLPPTDAGVSETLARLVRLTKFELGDNARREPWKRALEQADAALAIPAGDGVPSAIRDIAAERKRQIEAEGWTPAHDDAHDKGEMARAAGIYALIAGTSDHEKIAKGYTSGDSIEAVRKWHWPWAKSWFKPTTRRRDLVKAGALIAAEIERLDRLSTASTAGDRK